MLTSSIDQNIYGLLIFQVFEYEDTIGPKTGIVSINKLNIKMRLFNSNYEKIFYLSDNNVNINKALNDTPPYTIYCHSHWQSKPVVYDVERAMSVCDKMIN